MMPCEIEFEMAQAGERPVTGCRILLVDDESVFRELIEAFLKGQGHEVFSAGNGREAARWLSDHAVELVITDLCMPEADGMELLMELKKRGSRIPILVMSGGVHGEIGVMLRAAMLLGASRTIAKPFALQDLAAVVNDIVGHTGQRPDR